MRPVQPPRLGERPARKGQRGHFVIRYKGKEYPTRFGLDERESAYTYLKDWTLEKYTAEKQKAGAEDREIVPIIVLNDAGREEQCDLDFGDGSAGQVAIGSCLAYYAFKKGQKTGRAVSLRTEIAKATAFCGGWKVSKVNGETFFESYVNWRCQQRDARAQEGKGKLVSITTAKREVITLIAAINMAADHGHLIRAPKISIPSNIDIVNERYLTRKHLARLLLGALGWDLRGRRPTRNKFRINYHVARFILIAFYTGTRHDAVLHMGWLPSPTEGQFDLDAGTMYRRGFQVRETNKRRPATRIPSRLLAHLRRWRRLTMQYPVEHGGHPITGQLRRGYESAVLLSGLPSPDATGQKVTPHTLKHTCITLRLQAGQPIRDVAAFTGTSENTIRQKYSHHAAAEMGNIADFETGTNRGVNAGAPAKPPAKRWRT